MSLDDGDELFVAVSGLVEGLRAVNAQAVAAYTPIVEDILRRGE